MIAGLLSDAEEDTEVKDVKKRGRAVFASHPIPMGTYVCEYVPHSTYPR